MNEKQRLFEVMKRLNPEFKFTINENDLSSFNKDFTLNTKEAVESFERIISTSTKNIKVNKELLSPERQKQGELRIKQMLSR